MNGGAPSTTKYLKERLHLLLSRCEHFKPLLWVMKWCDCVPNLSWNITLAAFDHNFRVILGWTEEILLLHVGLRSHAVQLQEAGLKSICVSDPVLMKYPKTIKYSYKVMRKIASDLQIFCFLGYIRESLGYIVWAWNLI